MHSSSRHEPLGPLLAEVLADLVRAGVTDIPRPVLRPCDGQTTDPKPIDPMQTKIDQLLKKCNPDSSHDAKQQGLDALAAMVADCSACPELVANRTKTVFGSGNPNADLVFLGEGPGAEEDRQGLPFVGRSGQLLTDIIVKGMNLTRQDVYICNIVRCRPPENRNPSPSEVACCRPFLDATLRVIRPQYICCLGAVAATNLLGTTEPIGRLRGRIFDHGGAKVVCTFHPAYLLRNPPAKAEAWEDIKRLLELMGRTSS